MKCQPCRDKRRGCSWLAAFHKVVAERKLVWSPERVQEVYERWLAQQPNAGEC